MPRRAPRSRHRNAKLSARLLTPSGRPGRSGRFSIQYASSCLWTWRSRSAYREGRVSDSLIRVALGVVDRCLASSPTIRHQSASAGCSAGRERGSCSVGEVNVVLRSSTAQSDIRGLSGLGAGQDHVRRIDLEACAEWMVVAYPSLQGRPSRRLSRRQLTHPTPTYLAASCN